jgi:tetratricopeptide (TPR) repeat protein
MRLGRITEETIRDAKWADRQYELAYDYYFGGDWLSAEQLLREAIEVSPFDSRYRLLLAQVYCARGWLSMSFSELESLKNLDPDNSGAKSLEQHLRNKMRERNAAPRKRSNRARGWRSFLNFQLSWFH